MIFFIFPQQEDESTMSASSAMPDSTTLSVDTQQLPQPINDVQAEASHIIINLNIFLYVGEGAGPGGCKDY